MIPTAFEYNRAVSVEEAVSFLDHHGDRAKLLAGGHSLIPAMKLRLNAPEILVDISHLEELSNLTSNGDELHIGAGVTHRDIEDSDVIRKHCPALAELAAGIGDPQVRNRGTIGGSLAHADPSADYPALLLALNARIDIAVLRGMRSVAAKDFFLGLFATALEPAEIITRVIIPVLHRGQGAAYAKFANPASRYAIVGVAAYVEVDAGGACTKARIGITGAAPSPFRATQMENALVGTSLDDDAIGTATANTPDPSDLMGDLSAGASYRAHLCSVMAERAVRSASARARG